jgi:hypothetical protein
MGKRRAKPADNHYFQPLEIGSADELVRKFMELRAEGFWSFRGQRRQEWHLGLHLSGRDATADVCLKQFKKRCMEFPRPDYIDENDNWRWLFYAQHHRLRTRLLDWTTNPLVALYFAVENILSGCNDNDHFGAVWALKVRDGDFLAPDHAGEPETLHRWIMINPPPVTRRIVRQSGKFSYHPLGDDRFIDEEARRYPEELLVKIVLRRRDGSNPASEIRQHLGIMNVHHASLFPDVDGVAKFINSEWKDIAISFRNELRQPQDLRETDLRKTPHDCPGNRKVT